MDIKSYQDLEIWQKAMDLTMECYKASKKFPKSETYGLCNQLQRAVVSIPANIAEGRGRQHTKEFLQHLSIAYGSLAELETHILLAERLDYIGEEQVKEIMSKAAELGRMINGLQRSLKKKLLPDPRPLIPDNKGFSLVELLIAMVIASVVGIAGISIFSSSNWSYKTQEDITEAQQNVRVAADRLAKDIRMAGYGLPDPPFSITIDGQTFTSPITVINSSTGFDTITILGGEEEEIWLDVDADCSNTDADTTNNCNLPDVIDPNTSHASGSVTINITGNDSAVIDKLFDAGGAFDIDRRYISIGGTYFVTLSNATRTGMRATLTATNGLDRAYRDGTPVYIIRAVRYTINTALTGCSSDNPCLTRQDLATNNQVLAENIEDIQFAYGIDVSPRDGKMDDTADGTAGYASTDFRNAPTDNSSIVAVRATVVGMTRNQDMRGQTGFRRPATEDRAEGVSDGYRRRTLTKIIKVRNPRSGA